MCGERDKPKLDKNWGSKSLGHRPQITQQEAAGPNQNAGLRWLPCGQAASLLFSYFYPVVPSWPAPAQVCFTSISFCLQPNSWVSRSPGRLPSSYQCQRGNVWCLANYGSQVKDFTTFRTVWKAREFTLNQESHFPAFRGLKAFAHVCTCACMCACMCVYTPETNENIPSQAVSPCLDTHWQGTLAKHHFFFSSFYFYLTRFGAR